MPPPVQTLLLLVLLTGAFLVGTRGGRARERRRGEVAGSGAFAAGFRAGHLQGWKDGQAAAGPAAASVPAAPPGAQQSDGQVRPSAPAWMHRPIPPLAPVEAARPIPPAAPVQPARSAMPVPQEPAADRAARKEKRDRQNINVTLYVASLLLVAAGTLFVGTSLPEALRFAGVAAVTGLFYAAGLFLHAAAPRLRPAAVAFAGTGLALIPVAGLALYNFGLHDGPAAWLVTSFIGTVAYVAAAVRLDSKVIAYLSLTFTVSTAWSGVSVLGGALVWYFAALIGVAVVLTLLALVRPRWLPSVFLTPIMQLHPFLVPAVAAAVTVVPVLVGRGGYTLIMFLCGAYFALMAATPQSRFRVAHYYGARLSLTAAAAAGAWAVSDSLPSLLFTGLVLAALQALVLAAGLNVVPARLLGAAVRRQADALGTFGLQVLLTLLWGVLTQLSSGGDPSGSIPLWVPLLLALLTGLALAVGLGGAAEWAPLAALILAAAFGGSAGRWAPAGYLLLSGVVWAVRALPPAEPLRLQFVLAARIAATLAVPAIVWAVTGDGPGPAPVVSAFVLALVAQQCVTAVLVRAALPVLAPGVSLVAFTLPTLPALAALAAVDNTPEKALTAAALVLQLLASLGLGWALFRETPAESGWRAGAGELLPLGMAAALAGLAFAGVSLQGGNISLGLTVLYLVASALRRSGLQPRWSYWWMARAAATILVLTGFQQLRQDAGPLLPAGADLETASLAVLVLGLQLVFPLLAQARGRAPRGVLADAAVVLALQVAALAGLSTSGPESAMDGGWQLTAVAVVMALSAAAAGIMLRARPGAAVFAPAVLSVLLVFRAGSAPDVELILSIFAAFSAVMVVAAGSRTAKGGYFASARVLVLVLALVLSYDATVSATAVYVTFGLVLAAQHVLRWLMRHRLADVPFQQAAVWITLAAQAALPAGYLVADPDDGGRWVLLLHLALLLVSAAVASRVFAARGAAYLSVYAAVFGTAVLGPLDGFDGGRPAGGFLGAPLLGHDGVVAVLLVLSLAATGAGLLFRRNPPAGVERWLWLAAAGAFVGSALLLVPSASGWLTGPSVLVLAGVCFAASHLERWPALYLPAVVAALAGATAAAASLLEAVTGAWGSYLPWLAGCALATSVLYAVRWLRRDALATDPVRRRSLVAAAVLGLGLAASDGLWWEATSWAGAALLAATAAVCCAEAPAKARRVVAELGLFAMAFAVQRAVLVAGSLPGADWPDPFWTLQWYVVLAGVLGTLRLASGDRRAGRVLCCGGAALLTLSGLGLIFGGDPGQQLWVLALLAILLMAGLAIGERVFVWWGAAGVTVCIMWAMRHYTFALLALLAVALIAIALWRLNRTKPVAAGPAPHHEPADHA